MCYRALSGKQLHCVCLCEDDTDLLIQHSCDSKVPQLRFHPSVGQEDILDQRESGGMKACLCSGRKTLTGHVIMCACGNRYD